MTEEIATGFVTPTVACSLALAIMAFTLAILLQFVTASTSNDPNQTLRNDGKKDENPSSSSTHT